MTLFTGSPVSSADDGHEQFGVMDITDIEIGNIDRPEHFGGVRIPSVTIPKNATIDNAKLSVQIAAGALDEPQVVIYGQAADNPGVFTTAANNISSRTSTTATVAWDNSNLGADGTAYFDTPDLTSIVQELVNRSGWVSGNAMVFVFNSNGSAFRDLSFDSIRHSSGTHKAILTVNYTATTSTGGAMHHHLRTMGAR